MLFSLKLIIIFIFFNSSLYATSCILKDELKYDSCKKELQIFIDTDNQHKANDKMPEFDKFTTAEKTFLGHIKHDVWTKLDVKYIGEHKKSVIFINPKVMMDEINVFIYKNKTLVKQQLLGDIHNIRDREVKSRYSSFRVEFEPNDEITIISRIVHKGAFEVSWLVSSSDDFEMFSVKESTFIGIVVGILIALIFYNFIIYIRIKEKLHIMYVLHALTVLVFQITSTNLFFEFGLVLPSYLAWIVGYFSLVTLMLFGKYFFDTKSTMPIINKFMNFFIFLSLFFALYFIMASYYNSLMLISKWILLFTIPMILAFVLIVSIVSMYKKLNGALYYLFGQVGYLICFMYPQISNVLAIELTFISIYIATFGVLFDVLFLSIALSHKLAILKVEKESHQKLLLAQASFSNIGKNLASISHQYKTPLAHLSILVASLEAYIFKTDSTDSLLKEISSNMRKSISFMNETMNNFNNFYQNSNAKEEFSIAKEITYIQKMLEEKITALNVNITFTIDEQIEYLGYKNSFDNVMMILFENALDICKVRDIKDPFIKINISKVDNNILIIFEDNGGGIEIEPIENIFETFVSTKEASSGLGLSMCKILVENRLNGKIIVQNTQLGTLFKLFIS